MISPEIFEPLTCSFAATMGPVSWTYPAEIFPMKVRGKAVSITTVRRIRFSASIVLTAYYHSLIDIYIHRL